MGVAGITGAKRIALAVAAAVTVMAGTAACGLADGGTGRGTGLLYVNTAAGLTAVDPGTATVAFSAAGAVAAPNWSRLYRADPIGTGTRLTGIDPATGSEMLHADVSGSDLSVRAVSHDGGTVALGPPPPAGQYLPPGRTTSTIVIAEPGKGRSQRYDLPGNVAPEAFSEDRRTVFVIDYTPPEAPQQYQVRRLDLASRAVNDVFSKDADLQQAMGGTARTQALSPDGRRLYTLYSQQEGPSRRAFVHVLSLDQKWAHCVDLPVDFVDAADGAGALAVAPDGGHLYVTVASTRAVAEIDTRTLSVTRTAHLPTPDAFATKVGAPSAALAVDGAGHLIAGVDAQLLMLDRSDLRPRSTWAVAGTIVGVQPSFDDRRVYVAMGNMVAVVDPVSGHWFGNVTVAGATGISRTGVAPTPEVPNRGGLSCAC